MTLIAIHAGIDHADMITDTWAFSNGAHNISTCSKTEAVLHLDMAFATNGDEAFGWQWKIASEVLATQVTDFDQFVDQAPGRLRSVWRKRLADIAARNVQIGGDFKPCPPGVFHVGYSPSRGAYRAVEFAADNGFTPADLPGLFVIPSPLGVRPSDYEMRLHREAIGAGVDAGGERNFAARLARPMPPVPTTGEGWIRLAIRARADRATLPVGTKLKWLVGGTVHHTYLERGMIVQARVHEFDDTGAEAVAVFTGTLHPVGLAAPCPCGTGLPYVECCVAKVAGKPCWCGSGLLLGECCGRVAS